MADKHWIRWEIEEKKSRGKRTTYSIGRKKRCNRFSRSCTEVDKKYGYTHRTASRKPYISPVDMKKCLEFAKKCQFEEELYWQHVSKFHFGTDRKVKVWRNPNTALDSKNLTVSIKHVSGSVMGWGCFAASDVGALDFIDGIMDTVMCREILRKNFHPRAGIAETFRFYHDNKLKHKACLTCEWLLYNSPHSH